MLPYRGALFSFRLWRRGAAVDDLVVALTPLLLPRLLGLGRKMDV